MSETQTKDIFVEIMDKIYDFMDRNYDKPDRLILNHDHMLRVLQQMSRYYMAYVDLERTSICGMQYQIRADQTEIEVQ